MQTRLSLRYTGPAVDAGLMDVYEAAANMIAFSEFVVAAAKATYGATAEAKAEVAGFGRGSFVTDLIINIGGPMATLFSAVSTKDLLSVIKDAVALWKHLEGSPPSQVDRGDESIIKVTNNNGLILNVSAQTAHLVFGEKPGEAVTRFVREALSKEGMDGVSVDADTDGKAERVMEVSRQEAGWFVPVAPERPLSDVTVKVALLIEAPVFKDGNKWRFSDGSGSFYANIEDAAFLEQVDNGEAFCKGDTLVVEMRIEQRRQGERLLTDKTIIKVIEHLRRPSQGSFL